MAAALSVLLALAPGTGTGPAHADAGQSTRDQAMKIRMTLDDRVLVATLDDNATARDFAALLPLELTLEDYASTEKVSSLPRRLSTSGAPRSYRPSAGDITYYAPWGNLAIFYRSFSDSAGLVRLGAFDEGVEALLRDRPFRARFERVD